MPKYSTFPTLFDGTLQINVSKLKLWGYIVPGQIKSGILKWSHNGTQTGSISVCLNFINKAPFLKLNYKYNSEPREYQIQLISVPSNLGIGRLWYFLCPVTKKRCRILYSVDGHFLHREAFNGCMYESQTQSKYYRQLVRVTFGVDDLYSQLYKKHFKKTYAGKPTKKYLKILKQIDQAEDTETLQRLRGI